MRTKKSDAITIEEFTVSESWVNVTTWVPAYGADILLRQGHSYGVDVHILAGDVHSHAEKLDIGNRTAESILHSMSKDRTCPRIRHFYDHAPGGDAMDITVQIPSKQWEAVTHAARLLNVSDASFVRVALMGRALQMREYLRASGKA